VVTGGHNSFTFDQTDSESHNISVATAGDTVTDSGYDTFSQYMQGTETYGSFATVSTGYDSFTWAQTASDNLIITQNFGGTTLGAYTLYDMTVDDQIYQNFYDVGTDTLGASDSIRGGVDSYTWGSARDLVSTLSLDETGALTVSGVTSTFASLNTGLVEVSYEISGPPATTATLGTEASTSTSGSNDGADLTEVENAGVGPTVGIVVADQIGASTAGSAEHLGTSPNSLDTSSGLMSALGGMGVHAMSFEGSDILPTANPAGTSMWLEESNQYGQTPTNWVSHPSGIGYRRSSPGITTSGSGSGSGSIGPAIPGNPVTMDTGMSDGGNQDEINRLNNFITGGNENPTAMQPGPIGKAEQSAMPITPTGSPSAVAFGETTGRDVIGDVMNQQGGGTWTPYGNPLYHPSSASPSGPSGSERSGASGRGYGNGGYGGPPVNLAPPAASPPPPDDGDAIVGMDDPVAPKPTNPKLNLGPGDLVIISANYPRGNPEAGGSYRSLKNGKRQPHGIISPFLRLSHAQPKSSRRQLTKRSSLTVGAVSGGS
jgi:hypothetical protein